MNTANWHLVLNHLPLVGILIGLLILVTGFFWNAQPVIKRIAMGVFVFSAAAAIPAYLTGEGAEEVAEHLPGVAESFIEKHEDWGKIFFISTEILGLLALITLLESVWKNRFAPGLSFLVFLVAAGVLFTAKMTGTSGGEIRHTEIRQNVPSPQTGANEQTTDAEKDDDD